MSMLLATVISGAAPGRQSVTELLPAVASTSVTASPSVLVSEAEGVAVLGMPRPEAQIPVSTATELPAPSTSSCVTG